MKRHRTLVVRVKNPSQRSLSTVMRVYKLFSMLDLALGPEETRGSALICGLVTAILVFGLLVLTG
jgi:hypothetical protein